MNGFCADVYRGVGRLFAFDDRRSYLVCASILPFKEIKHITRIAVSKNGSIATISGERIYLAPAWSVPMKLPLFRS